MGTSQRLTRTLPLAAALLLIIVSHAPARAQSSETQPKKPQPKESPQTKETRVKEPQTKEAQARVFCDPSRAVSLVETQLSEAKMFEAVERRLSVMTRAADLLWSYERETAREIFRQAYDLAEKDFREHENDPPPQHTGSISVLVPRIDQRFVVMTAIARRDPAWARQLAESVAEEKLRDAETSSNAAAAERGKQGVGENTLNLAQSLLPVDRGAATGLVRKSFRYPATYTLILFLFKLAETNQAEADGLYMEALSAYHDRSASDLAYLAVYPFALNREPAGVPMAVYYQPPKGFAPTPRLREAFLTFLFQQVEETFKSAEAAPAGDVWMSEAGNLLVMLTTLEPLIARLNPSMLGRALALKGTATAAANAESRERAESFARMLTDYDEEGLFDRTLQDVDGERDSGKRDFAIARLVMSANNAEQFARAEALLDKVDAPLREKLASYLYFLWTQHAVKDGQIDEATRLSKKVSELDYRALLSFEIADAALKKLNDHARAAELLDAVVSDAEKAPDTSAKARALFGAANLYSNFDVPRAAQVLRASVKVVNLLPNPDFGSETIGRELGNSWFTTYAVYRVPGMSVESPFRELGAHDFESALSAANDLTDKYQRALAVLGLASKCLEDSATKPNVKPTPKKAR